MELVTRRSILRGLFAAPAVVAFGSLMPVRGLIMPVHAISVPVHVWEGLYTETFFVRWMDGTLSTLTRKDLVGYPDLTERAQRAAIEFIRGHPVDDAKSWPVV